MKADVLAHFPYIGATCFALLLFMTLFVAALAWVFRKSSRSFYQYVASIPLQEEKPL